MDSRVVAWALHRYDEALKSSERYLTRFPDDPLSYVFNAQLLMEVFGDLSHAAETIQRARRWGESHPWTDAHERELAATVLSAIEAILAYGHRDFARASACALNGAIHLGEENAPSYVVGLPKGKRSFGVPRFNRCGEQACDRA
jgi:hypothetical protein